MTTTVTPPAVSLTSPEIRRTTVLQQSWIMVKRNLIHTKRMPEMLADVTVQPGTPARTQQMPRTIISTRTPAQLASLILAMICGSLMELFFRMMDAGLPCIASAI